MKYKNGQIVKRVLTNEYVQIIGLIPGLKYRCTDVNGEIWEFEEVEIESLLQDTNPKE